MPRLKQEAPSAVNPSLTDGIVNEPVPREGKEKAACLDRGDLVRSRARKQLDLDELDLAKFAPNTSATYRATWDRLRAFGAPELTLRLTPTLVAELTLAIDNRITAR